MSYNTDCIEIRPDGDVIAGGNLVGKIEFAGKGGILGRLYGVGVHTLGGEGFNRDWSDDYEPNDDLLNALCAMRRAVGILSMAEPDIKAAIAILRRATS